MCIHVYMHVPILNTKMLTMYVCMYVCMYVSIDYGG